ncbi:hypothetical protein Tco_1247728 [Tanacetum coccineum]
MATNEETYDQPLAMTTTNMFQANHEDAYDSDVDEGPNAAAAFMANLSSTSATNSQVNEVHSNDNQIFDNVDYQLSQEMHQEEHLDSDAETEIDDNTIPYHQYLLDTEAQNVPTEVSADTSDKVSMIAILTDLQTQLDGHAKVNQEKCLEIETLKNELLQCKQEICRLDTHKVKLDLENKVRQEQALVIQRNMRNAELVQENDLLKSTLSGKEKSIAFLQSEKEKILSEKKDLADSYLDEIVCLKNANKVARDILQRFNMPTQTIPMLSKKPKAATADLHKDLLGSTEVVGSVKPQWKPTGRHFALYDNCPLTRIMEPIVEPLELTPSVSSSSKVTMISRFPDCKLSDRKAGSKGISERLTRPTAYKFKTDCSIIPVWYSEGHVLLCETTLYRFKKQQGISQTVIRRVTFLAIKKRKCKHGTMATETQQYHKRLSSGYTMHPELPPNDEDVENSTGSENGFFKILEGNKISLILKAMRAKDCISSSSVKCNTPPTPLP